MADKRYHLAVRALVLDSEGRCLIIRRSRNCRRFVGQWEWPGGKVDEGESFDAGLRREIREEVGLEVTLTGVVGAYDFPVGDKQIAMLCMEARSMGGEVNLSDEHDLYKWVPLEDLEKLPLTDGLRDMAKAYIATRACG